MALIMDDLSKAACDYTARAGKQYIAWNPIGRETFRDYRIPRNGVCMTHMDTEPCAECWIPGGN